MPTKRSYREIAPGKLALYSRKKYARPKRTYTPRPTYMPTRQELKFLDTAFTTTTVPVVGTITLTSANLIAQGTGESQRIGRKATIVALSVRYVVQIKPTTNSNNTDDGLRLIVYHDKQANGAAPAVTDILKTADYLSYNNLANKDRFVTLKDDFTDMHSMAGGGSTATFGEVGITKQVHLRCNIPVEFSGTAGLLAEVRSNNIGILAISDSADVSLEGLIRIRYSDA